jgi:hypothetical protein
VLVHLVKVLLEALVLDHLIMEQEAVVARARWVKLGQLQTAAMEAMVLVRV